MVGGQAILGDVPMNPPQVGTVRLSFDLPGGPNILKDRITEAVPPLKVRCPALSHKGKCGPIRVAWPEPGSAVLPRITGTAASCPMPASKPATQKPATGLQRSSADKSSPWWGWLEAPEQCAGWSSPWRFPTISAVCPRCSSGRSYYEKDGSLSGRLSRRKWVVVEIWSPYSLTYEKR